jgi:hypothetical protein
MPRTSAEVTPQEIQIFERFCMDNNIFTDGPVGQQNVIAIGDYIIDLWKEEITEHTLSVALEKLREAGRITFYTPVQAKYKKIAAEDIERANQLNAWFHSQANTSLLKDGDEGLENQAALLVELRGREISQKTIQDAAGRLSYRSGLHFVPVSRPVDPRQHKDDGSGFLRDEKNPRYRNGRINHAYQEPGSQQETPKNLDPSEARWREMAEALRGNTHSKNAELERIQGKNWRETYELRKKALNVNPVTIGKFGVA